MLSLIPRVFRPAAARIAGWCYSRFGTVRSRMLRAARRAPRLLGDSTPLVREFLLARLNPDGGFQGRTPESDLYYSVFGLDALTALGVPFPRERTAAWLRSFGDGGRLNFVHLCCLARACAAIDGVTPPLRRSILYRIEAHRAHDGGYHPVPGQPHGTAYAAFLAQNAHHDLRSRIPEPRRLVESLRQLLTPDGAWANERGVPGGSTNATAAALAVLSASGADIDYEAAVRWLLAQHHPLGGFRASPLAPVPDLLSTATALYTLTSIGVPLGPVREPCLDFVDSLWDNRGSFHAHWHEDDLDVEYTFYGLLALGCLAYGQASRALSSPREH